MKNKTNIIHTFNLPTRVIIMSSEPRFIHCHVVDGKKLFAIRDLMDIIQRCIDLDQDEPEVVEALQKIWTELSDYLARLEEELIIGKIEDVDGEIMIDLVETMENIKIKINSYTEKNAERTAYCYCYNLLKQLIQPMAGSESIITDN